MDTARATGLSREEVGEKVRALDGQLTEQLSTFLPAGDAEAIVASMRTPGGGGPGFGSPPGPPPGGSGPGR